MFEWMAWTTPVVVFFVCIALMLAGMTVWEIKSPTVLRKGFLPIATTRGDRLFIGLLAAAYFNLIWVGLGEKMLHGLAEVACDAVDAALRPARARPHRCGASGFAFGFRNSHRHGF